MFTLAEDIKEKLMPDFSKKPTQPPSGADMNALIARVNELSQKVLNKTFSSKLPSWKRWVGGESDYDATGLRDVVNANAYALDNLKDDLDDYKSKVNPAISDLKARVSALETQPNLPFPGSG